MSFARRASLEIRRRGATSEAAIPGDGTSELSPVSVVLTPASVSAMVPLMGRLWARFALLTLLVWGGWSATAHAEPVTKFGYIRMADGVKLRYAAVLPDAAGRYPVAMKY